MLNQNKSYELTTAQLKKYEGFENVTEEEAKEVIFQLRELSFIFYESFKNQSNRESMLSSSRVSVNNHKEKNVQSVVRCKNNSRKNLTTR